MSMRSMNARSLVRDRVVDLDLLEPVREPPRVEAVLELARAVVVEPGHVPSISDSRSVAP